MSQRSAFTSEYIYYTPDYEILRARAEKWGNGKYLCFAPEASWVDAYKNEMPILQGKIGSISAGGEYIELCDFLRGVKTKYPVTFIILPECHDSGEPIQRVLKTPDGVCHLLRADEEKIQDMEIDEIPGVIRNDYGDIEEIPPLGELVGKKRYTPFEL